MFTIHSSRQPDSEHRVSDRDGSQTKTPTGYHLAVFPTRLRSPNGPHLCIRPIHDRAIENVDTHASDNGVIDNKQASKQTSKQAAAEKLAPDTNSHQ